jgi:DNA-binding NarL/FixJ family response regulator
MEIIRVLIVDDQPHVRKGLQAILSTSERMRIVGCASNGIEAIHLAQKHCPDVILLDAHMPYLDGFEAAKTLLELVPADRIILMDTKGDTQFRSRARAWGMHSYLIKNQPETNLMKRIEQVADNPSQPLKETNSDGFK